MVLEVCERAFASEANAKEAARALHREFKQVSSILHTSRFSLMLSSLQVRGA